MQRESRANKYQHLFRESTYAPEAWASIGARNQVELCELTAAQCDALFDLDEQLRLRMWELIDCTATDHQRAVLWMTYKGMTQWEIADELGCDQSGVHKVLHGNTFYKGGVIRRYGGLAKKLQKAITTDAEIHVTMQKIDSLYDPSLRIRLPHFQCFKRLVGTSIQYQQYVKEPS